MFRRLGLLTLMVAALGVAAPALAGLAGSTAHGGVTARLEKSHHRVGKARRSAGSGAKRGCVIKNGRRQCKTKSFVGHGISAATLRTEPVAKPSGKIWLYMVNFDEEIKVDLYDEEGNFNDASLALLDHAFRCRRTNEERAVDPRLYQTLSVIADHFGNERIELVSGFRYHERDSSRHFHASAMDIRVPAATNQELYDFAQSLDPGGMGIGIYPNSGFVHVDMRAPGEPSYRWTDYSGSDAKKSKKAPKHRTAPARKPTS